MAALTYTAVLERLHGDAGAPLKATSEPLSDGLSSQHSCFRRTRGSGGSSRAFHLHMVFLRSHRPECCHFCTSPPSATRRSCFSPSFLLFSHKLNFFSFNRHAESSKFPSQLNAFRGREETLAESKWPQWFCGRQLTESQLCFVFCFYSSFYPVWGYDSMWMLKICCFLSNSFFSSSIIETWPVIPINQLEQKFVVSLVQTPQQI